MDPDTLIVQDFHQWSDKSQTDIIEQVDLTDINRIVHAQTQMNIHSSQHLTEKFPESTTYSITKHISTDTKIEIIPFILSDY